MAGLLRRLFSRNGSRGTEVPQEPTRIAPGPGGPTENVVRGDGSAPRGGRADVDQSTPAQRGRAAVVVDREVQPFPAQGGAEFFVDPVESIASGSNSQAASVGDEDDLGSLRREDLERELALLRKYVREGKRNHPPSRIHSLLDLTAPLPSVRKPAGNTTVSSSVDVSGKLLRGSVPKGMPAPLQFSNEHIGRVAEARDIEPRELGRNGNAANRFAPSESFSMRSSVHAETGPQRDVSRGQPAQSIGDRGPSADIHPVQNKERGRPASAS